MEVYQIRCLSKSGHYFVYVGQQMYARWKWSDVYPSIPFDTVRVTAELIS
jgi:hypothetical protein